VSLSLTAEIARTFQMNPVAETIAAVGPPIFMRTVGETSSPNAMIARWRHGGGEFDIGASDFVRVSLNLQNGGSIRHRIGAGTPHSHMSAVGSISITPAQQRTQIEIPGPADVLHIFLHQPFLESAVERPLDCRAMFDSHDSQLQAAAVQLFVAATRGDPEDPLLLESGVRRIADRLLNHGDRRPPEPACGGLARGARQRVDDLIVASLADMTVPSPTLDQLAAAACMSVNHFIRVFHQQTGVTPHRYIVLRRLERGIALLKTPAVSVAEVADDVGFATPAHFVATFRRTMGVTPGAFRAAVTG
jgi:AraC family transcriptional regulator